MKKDAGEKEELLMRIARYLIINAPFTEKLGLYHGKMGIILFFALYARYSQNSMYNDFWEALLYEIFEDIYKDYPLNMENGLCGIGLAIEYLAQNQFIKGDTGEILEDINVLIMERDPLRISDVSFRKGLAGVHYYVHTHLCSPSAIHASIDAEYVKNVSIAVQKNDCALVNIPISSFLYANFLVDNSIEISPDSNLSLLPLGVDNGIAGIGLKLMRV
ncbi:MAG TPA: hypothetical protein DEQ30_11525 [Porphyromonadaceae bacterium]|nr:hypothetical protein [Porphyromonadaceae bacterium]